MQNDHAAAPVRLLVTITEACQALSVSRPYLYRLMRSGELASVKLGRARRIPVEELEHLVARHQQGGDTA